MEIVSVPVILALVEMLKKSGLSSRFAPIVSLALGIVFGFVWVEGDWMLKLGAGIILGLSASGLYSGTKAVVRN